MNLTQIFVPAILSAAVSYGVCEYRTPKVITVDVQKIIKSFAQDMASNVRSENQELNQAKLETKLTNFKEELSQSLKAFALRQKAIVVHQAIAWGPLPDMTEAFVTFHNAQGEK